MAVAARRERKWTQDELAEKLARHAKTTATQALISQIESGKIVSSKLIRPMCELLDIPEPMHFTDELMKAWWSAGHLLRGKNMNLFRTQLEALQSMIKALGAGEEAAAGNENKPQRNAAEEKQPPRK